MSTNVSADDLVEGVEESDPSEFSEGFYSDDVQAQAIADSGEDQELVEDDTDPVTSGNISIGDMDADSTVGQGSEESFDEENDVPDLVQD